MSKPKINKIVIEVGGKKLEFTPDEAKELKSLLGELFGGETTRTVVVDRYRDYWHWPATYPVYSNATIPAPVYKSNTWCGLYDNQSAALTLSTRT